MSATTLLVLTLDPERVVVRKLGARVRGMLPMVVIDDPCRDEDLTALQRAKLEEWYDREIAPMEPRCEVIRLGPQTLYVDHRRKASPDTFPIVMKFPQEPDMHPSVAHILPFFAYEHLPPHLQEVSKHFHWLAHALVADAPTHAASTHRQFKLQGPELTVALRKLLEAKDAAVRAALTPND